MEHLELYTLLLLYTVFIFLQVFVLEKIVDLQNQLYESDCLCVHISDGEIHLCVTQTI